MTFNATLDSRKIISFTDAGAGSVINVSSQAGKLVFTLTPSVGLVLAPLTTDITSFAGFTVPTGVTLILDAALANGKAMVGAGMAIAKARSAGENLSGYELYTDGIWLADGAAYTLTAAQALLSQIGSSGAGDLRSSNSNSKITLVSAAGADLTAIQIDKNDTVVLTAGQSYTLTGEQALVAKVGTGAVGDLTACAKVTVHATMGADLSSLKLEASDVIVLDPGKDYALTSALVTIARVGIGGSAGALATAGAVTVRASAAGEDLSTLRAEGIDVYELTAGKAYTLNASQLAATKVGASGVTGNTSNSGQLTIKAGTLQDLTRLPTKVFADAKGVADLARSDIVILEANVDYKLTSDQAKVAKVGTAATAKAGELGTAGQITVVAGLSTASVFPSRAEDLSGFASKGVDFYELAAGADYVLTTTQAKAAKVGDSGALGNLATTGNLTLIAQPAENLTQIAILGVDEYRLAAGQTYSLSAEQALQSRVITNGSLGGYGDISGTKTTVVAGATGDLTRITIDANDVFLLSAGRNYALTTAQARVSRVDDGPVGALAKAGLVTVRANAQGEDLATTLAAVTGYDNIVLAAGGKYSLTSEQAKLAQVASSSQVSAAGDLTLAGATTLVANAAGEDLSGLTVSGLKAIALTAGKDYTMTALQASMARVGATGVTADMTAVGPVPATGGTSLVKTGIITVVGATDGFDFTQLKTDANDVLVLTRDFGGRLTAAQAAVAKVGAEGALGDLTGVGSFRVVADVNNTDLSKIKLESGDLIELTGGQNYTLGSSQVAMVRMGGVNSLTKAGMITVIADAPDGDLTGMPAAGIDILQLSASAASYTLRTDQALVARVGATGALGDLSGVTGAIYLRVAASTSTSFVDLTKVNLKASDGLELAAGSNYILTAKQAANAVVIVPGSPGAAGDLTSAGLITVVPGAGDDLTVLLANAKGIDRIELDPELAYTLTDAQARMATYVKGGQPGPLASKFAGGKLTVIAGETADLTGLQMDNNDRLILQTGKAYTVTAEQAAVSQFGLTGTPGALARGATDDTASVITVRALKGADLTRLTLDSNDRIELGADQKYTLTSSQAKIAVVQSVSGNTIVTSAVGNLTTAGAVRVIASALGEDLASLALDGNDTLVLTAGVNYTLTAAQAASTVIGATGAKGKLAGAGVITVKAPTGGGDLTGLSLDTSGLATVMDVIELAAAQNYTLTSGQAAVARVGATGAVGQLGTAGTITVVANGAGEDLSTTLATATGVDAIVLARGKNYTLNKEQLASARVEAGVTGDLKLAGVVTLKSAPSGVTEDLSTVANITGVDRIMLKSGVNTTLTDEQAAIAVLGASTRAQDLRGSEIMTIKSNDQGADLSAILTDKDDLIWVGAAANYTINSAQVARLSTDGLAVTTAAAPDTLTGTYTLKASAIGEDLSGVSTGAIDSVLLTLGRNYTLTAEQAAIATLDPNGNAANIGKLTKAGVVTVVANASGDSALKATMGGVTGVDALVLADAKDYTLSAGQAAVAKIGASGALGALTSTGVLTINDTGVTAGRQDLTRLVLDASDTLTLGTGDYDLTSLQLVKAGASAAAAGTVNLWGNALAGEDLSGIATAAVDKIYLAAGRDYTLNIDQVAKAQVGATGTAGNISKAGTVTLRLADGGGISALDTAVVKGVDVLQLMALDTGAAGISYTLKSGISTQVQVNLDATSAALNFAKNTTSGVTGGGNTGSDTTVNAAGEWTFVNATDVLTVWNATTNAAQAITLVGVASVAADGSAILKIGF